MQRARYIPAEMDDLCPHLRFIQTAGTKVPPIEILAGGDDLKHRAIAPQLLVLERGDRNVEDGKHQILAAKLGFAR